MFGQKLNRKKNGFTWCDGSDTAKNRIDYVFLTHLFCYKPKNIYLRRPPSISNVRMSYHITLIFKCEISSNSRRKGYWKLNTSVLLDIQYCKIINDFLLNLPDDIKLEMNPKTKWELIKLKVKHLSISYCKEKSKNMKRKIQLIEGELEQIEHQHHLNINMIRKKELENELDALYEIKSKGAQIRSRAKSKDIPLNEIESYLAQINTSAVLSENDTKYCEHFPTLQECAEVVNGMKNNKSPGIDGLPVEFYKMFWKNIRNFLYEAISQIYIEEELFST